MNDVATMADSEAKGHKPQLSRAVSHVDLADALTALPSEEDRDIPYFKHERPNKYTPAEMLALRPKDGGHVDVHEIASPPPEALMTPPNEFGAVPPPPTPATPGSTVTVTPDENAQPHKEFFTRPSPLTLTPVEEEALKGTWDRATEATPPAAPAQVEGGKKKKKKSGGKSKNKKAVTGFEEFYADPPLTPDEHDEECDLYDLSLPFADRIQTCIQRYRARRCLDEKRSNIFTKYLMLGGVDSTAKAFTGGLDKETLENSTADEIAAIRALDYVQTGTKNQKFYDGSENWVVDFEGVVKGFFSYRIPCMFPTYREEEIKLYCLVIRNFLNYVLQHAVCQEYTENVMAARKIVDLAEKELWAISQLQKMLPGDFNIAASTLYGGRYKAFQLRNSGWEVTDPALQDFLSITPGFDDIEAERIFKTAVALAGDDDLFMKTMSLDVEIVKTERKFYEVVEIERASISTVEEYKSVKNSKGETGYIKALGVVKFKPWEGPGLDPEDFTDDEDATVEVLSEDTTLEAFWLEDKILDLFFVGLKLEVEIKELNIGLRFMDTICGLHCSFHTYLPNEKMVHWKEPTPNTRPPPTEDDPDVEERAIDAEVEREYEAIEKDFK